MSAKAFIIASIVSVMIGILMGRLSIRIKWSLPKTMVATYIICVGVGYVIHLLTKS